MVHLTRVNYLPVVINCDLIEQIESTPDTVIFMTSGQRIRVRETSEEVVQRVIDYKRRIYVGTQAPAVLLSPGPAAPTGGNPLKNET